jgi:hypothetical protein
VHKPMRATANIQRTELVTARDAASAQLGIDGGKNL